MIQGNLFNFIDVIQPTIPVIVQKVEDNIFLAIINNGWWMAYGKTKDAAVKNVIKRYETERNYFNW